MFRIYNFDISLFFSLKGAHKNGKQVAIKAIRNMLSFHAKREAEMLSACAHENVVKFYGLEEIEKVAFFTRYALAMELCQNGSLKQMIRTNPNGLETSEFYRVVQHLTNSIDHLNSLQIVHRDIKPDNIVVGDNNGRNIYKITDFGSARRLQPSQTYASFHGTFEYASPDMFANFYRQDIKMQPSINSFTESHDLWSIGVTIYETATGKLPFLPINGRKDPETMYTMISKKKNGHISAIESSNKIKWQKGLPESCRIKNDLHIRKLLAGLLKVSAIFKLYHVQCRINS